ncbi:hypothetical protein ACFSHT_08915 [Paraburkholderia silviterrae]|uniref:Uncharacterized protein n=1 Tax=Paraburkholderia silviterrae TaxID=2528715 RepID=A0A4R5MDE8_9BURK|nr:hypothetical protein [Paraburkholderia silviterrae]TDG25116.1 hypothetical protein EYW47_04425 [Paraburkholderia silviterrae]
MSLVPSVVGAVATTNAAEVGISGRLLISIAAAVLFGLIGLVPLLGDEPKTKPAPPAWTVVDAGRDAQSPIEARLRRDDLTIDGEVREIKEPPKLAGADQRWGR